MKYDLVKQVSVRNGQQERKVDVEKCCLYVIILVGVIALGHTECKGLRDRERRNQSKLWAQERSIQTGMEKILNDGMGRAKS